MRLTTWVCFFAAVLWRTCGACYADEFAVRRHQMVEREIRSTGVVHARVLEAMRSTPRHEFVPAGFRHLAYQDVALPIGDEQTISPPYIVAYMTEQLDPQPTDRVLEIGTGSGYQAAVLSPLVAEVYSIEIVENLGRRARRTLKRLGYKNVHVRVGDGFAGWSAAAPFDKIIVTCSPEEIPLPLVEQLAEDGQMVVPVGERYQQNLYRVAKRAGKLHREPLQATLFVPMTGLAEDARQVFPDPAAPRIINGSFERSFPNTNQQGRQPLGWHYLRGARLIRHQELSPAGEHYLSFENDEPGHASRALQGFAIDGREVGSVRISLSARGQNLKAGLVKGARAAMRIAFYDRRRAVQENRVVAAWNGSFPWTVFEKELPVKPGTREAIVRIGLLGGTGQLDVDDLSLQPISAP